MDVRDGRSQFASDAVRRIRLSKPVQLSVHASNSQMRCHGVRLSQAFIGHAKEGLQHIERLFETELVFQIVRVGEQRGDCDARILLLKRVGDSPHEAREMARLGSVGRELAAHPFGSGMLIAKHVRMRRPAARAEQVDQTEREKRPVAEPCVGRRGGASPREAPEEHRVRQTVQFRTCLCHHRPPSLQPDGVPRCLRSLRRPRRPPRSRDQVIASPARSKHPATRRACARRHHDVVDGSAAGSSPCR